MGARDLSETSITSLPTLGLTDLDFLYLEKTPSLKVFPSIYSFKSIKEAHLTYPYHCCAFQFPEQHDPKQYIRHQEFIRKMEELCSDLTTPNIPVMASTIRSRPRQAFPTYIAPMEGFPSHIITSTITETVPEDSSGQSEPDDRWESSLSRESGGVVSLPLPTSTMMARDAKRESYKLSVHSPATSSDAVSRYWKMRLDSGSYSLSPVNAAHSRTRHKGHHAHRARLKLALNPDYKGTGMFMTEHKLEDLMSRSRRGEHSELVGLSDTGDVTRYNLLPTSQQDQRTAALMREPEKELIPYPEKRFHTDENSHTQQEVDESFIGGGAIGGYHTPYSGFGNFNSTSNRFHGLSIRRNDSSQSSGGHDPERMEHLPALDSGDDKTYGVISGQNNTQGFPIEDNGHQYSSEGFPKDGGFSLVPGKDEVSSKKKNAPDSGWHPSVPLPKNETRFIPCGNLSKDYHYVLCVPEPDAFNPCEDIMGNLALRVAVWLVVVTAVLGNLAVIIVLISSKFKMTVSKFLMVNLALADLCMGLYLLIIAVMDLHTIGVYFNHAIDWQNGPGCKVAGFLTVFASELSIFTLTVITSERWYAITYAIHLNKRLKLSMAVKIMVVGWTYSITMAALPLLGISSYSKTSICLPMETGNALALAYLISLLLVNGLAFFVITACYASMYCSISRHDATAPHSDLTVAKRMALLVFTDFACWAPIAFFGLTAVAGVPLINVTRAKILLVFFYPLNSCANPYLYAILTKQYRRDLFILLARYGFCTKRAMRYKGAYSSVNNTLPHNTVVNAPNHRNSTLTQITLCDLTRTARASQQSNNGSLLGTMIGGSQDSLQRNVSPLRTPTKPETVAGENERLSTVQEMSHSTHSDEDASDDHGHHDDRGRPNDQESPSGVVKLAGSPHPIKNCYTRMSFTPEQEEILKQALQESKVKKKARTEAGMKSSASQTLLADNSNPVTEDGKSLGQVMAENGKSPGLCAVDSKKSITQHLPEKAKSPCHEMIEHAKLFAHKIVESGKSSSHGEAFVICEVEINHGRNKKNLGKKNGLEEVEEATSTL
nr:uncharacterized protein LOC123768835 [Procambarus clarkii]